MFYNNISRHIKITSMVLNFVTEILQQFPRIENNVWILNFLTEISSNFALMKIKNKVFGTNYVSRTIQPKMKLVWYEIM